MREIEETALIVEHTKERSLAHKEEEGSKQCNMKGAHTADNQ